MDKNWKQIFDEAQEAKKACMTREDIQLKFGLLLKKYPDDPMVYLVRGETWDGFGVKDSACEDYLFAYEHFPQQQWKNKAKEHILALCCK